MGYSVHQSLDNPGPLGKEQQSHSVAGIREQKQVLNIVCNLFSGEHLFKCAYQSLPTAEGVTHLCTGTTFLSIMREILRKSASGQHDL